MRTSATARARYLQHFKSLVMKGGGGGWRKGNIGYRRNLLLYILIIITKQSTSS